MIVCLCEGIPLRQVVEAISSGAESLDEIGRRCGAGRDCGACQEDLVRLLDASRMPTAPGGTARDPRRPCSPER